MVIESGPFIAVIPDGIAPLAPLVVIFAWAGATDRSLSKYADLLAREGTPTVRSVQPTRNIFSPWERPRRQWASSLLRFLESQRLCPGRPLVLYSFSNGGAFVVEQLKKMAEQEARYAYLKQAVIGFVFDSSPGYLLPGVGRRVLEAETPPGLRRTVAVAANLALERLAPLLQGDRPALYWEQMADLDWGCPFLFLYSADDPLCDAASLDGLLAEKRARGQRVRAVRWERSEHCAHLRHHKEEYSSALLAFLRGLGSAEGARARL